MSNRSTPKSFRTPRSSQVPCKYFSTLGYCNLGDHCAFMHDTSFSHSTYADALPPDDASDTSSISLDTYYTGTPTSTSSRRVLRRLDSIPRSLSRQSTSEPSVSVKTITVPSGIDKFFDVPPFVSKLCSEQLSILKTCDSIDTEDIKELKAILRHKFNRTRCWQTVDDQTHLKDSLFRNSMVYRFIESNSNQFYQCFVLNNVPSVQRSPLEVEFKRYISFAKSESIAPLLAKPVHVHLIPSKELSMLFVYEYLPGETLDSVLASEGVIPRNLTNSILTKIFLLLNELHTAQLFMGPLTLKQILFCGNATVLCNVGLHASLHRQDCSVQQDLQTLLRLAATCCGIIADFLNVDELCLRMREVTGSDYQDLIALVQEQVTLNQVLTSNMFKLWQHELLTSTFADQLSLTRTLSLQHSNGTLLKTLVKLQLLWSSFTQHYEPKYRLLITFCENLFASPLEFDWYKLFQWLYLFENHSEMKIKLKDMSTGDYFVTSFKEIRSLADETICSESQVMEGGGIG
ncbi:hypothetical protein RCL1_006115 [Eukaryota sp. TZLM3-RCL]